MKCKVRWSCSAGTRAAAGAQVQSPPFHASRPAGWRHHQRLTQPPADVSAMDGYAVRAADTYGASEGLPSYLELAGEARMGRPPKMDVRSGTAVAIATGAP